MGNNMGKCSECTRIIIIISVTYLEVKVQNLIYGADIIPIDALEEGTSGLSSLTI